MKFGLGRKYRSAIVLAGLVLLNLGNLGAAPIPPATPTPAAATNMEPAATAQPITDIAAFHLVSSEAGWLLTNQHLYWTRTGGQSWEDITPPDLGSFVIQAVTFLDAQSGRVILSSAGADGQPLYAFAKTGDGGRTWQTSPLALFAPGEVQALASAVYIDFIEPQVGWLVIKQATSSNFSLGTLFKTSDGGQTWLRLLVPMGEPVYFVTDEAGWMAGGVEGNGLYRTQDGGRTWLPQTPNSLMAPQPLYQLPAFKDAHNGVLPVITTAGNQSQVEFHVTEDGGQTWRLAARAPLPSAIAPGTPLPLSIFDEQHWALIAPGSRQLQRMSDAGETTITLHDPITATISALDMVTPEAGWAEHTFSQCTPTPGAGDVSNFQMRGQCYEETKLLRTEDGGQNWNALPLPPAGAASYAAANSFIAQSQPNPQAGSGNQAGLSIQGLGARTQAFSGQGFDKCTVPTADELQTWFTSGPYRAVNLYIGGSSRGCLNADLSPSLVTQLIQQGWRLLPTWVGPQAACSSFSSRMSTDLTTAEKQGAAEADAAIDAAANLGLTLADRSGTVIYYDLENFNVKDAGCVAAAKAFISGWSGQLRAKGNQAGVYGSACSSGISDFAGLGNVPDAIWVAAWLLPAQYRGDATVWNLACIDNSLWTNHQRTRQYAGDHTETWPSPGGVPLAIDSNVIDGIVATGSDTTPPTVHTSIVPLYGDGTPYRDFDVDLAGSDDLSGIATYDLQSRDGPSGAWTDVMTNTTRTSYHFVGDDGHTYFFRARAQDRAGNQSVYPAEGDSQRTIRLCTVAPDKQEPDNTPANAKPFAMDSTQAHNFDVEADQDWVTFTVQAGALYNLATANIGGYADTVLDLYNTDGTTLLAENDDDPNNWPASRLVWQAPASGTYYAKVSPFDIYGYGCASAYNLTISKVRSVFLPMVVRR